MLFLLAQVAINVAYGLNWNDPWYIKFIGYYIVIFESIFMSTFVVLMVLMWKLHHLEFVTHRKTFFAFFIPLCAISLFFAFSLGEIANPSQHCQKENGLRKMLEMVTIFIINNNFHILILAYCVLELKKNDDIISGISKLDYLLRVS